MAEKEEWATKLRSSRIIAVLRYPAPDILIEAVQALVQGGIRFIEVTLTVPRAFEVLERLAQVLPDNAELGVGSVRTIKDARRATNSGARFIVSPTLNTDIIEIAISLRIPVIPALSRQLRSCMLGKTAQI